jgi:hypothetical protein
MRNRVDILSGDRMDIRAGQGFARLFGETQQLHTGARPLGGNAFEEGLQVGRETGQFALQAGQFQKRLQRVDELRRVFDGSAGIT